jgi:hypothetical protein
MSGAEKGSDQTNKKINMQQDIQEEHKQNY